MVRRDKEDRHSPEKLKALYVEHGHNLSSISAAIGVSRPTLYKWYEEDGTITKVVPSPKVLEETPPPVVERPPKEEVEKERQPRKKFEEVTPVDFVELTEFVKARINEQNDLAGAVETTYSRWFENCSPMGNQKQYRVAKDTIAILYEFLLRRGYKIMKERG